MALALAVLVAAAGCGRGGDGPGPARAGVPAPAETGSAAASAPGPAADAEEDPTAAPGAGTSAVRRPTVVARAPSATAGAGAGGVTFPVPGTYRYAATGRFTSTIGGTQSRDGEVVLTVEPAAGADQRSVRTGPGRSTEQVLRVQDGSALLVSLRLVEQGMTKEVRPEPPVLALPGDAAPGRTWSWQARSTDARTEIASSFRAVRTEDVTVGGTRVPALVVEVVITATGDLTMTSNQTLWVSALRGLVVRQDDATQGRLGAISFTSTSSETLLSLAPA